MLLPDYDLSIMKDKQTLFDVTTNILNRIKDVLEKEKKKKKPDVVLVHGDTSTTFVTAFGLLLSSNSSWTCRGRASYI